MKLHHTSSGDGPPVVILHGLFGGGDNWQGISRRMATAHRVFAPDLRNHGRSPHAATMSYDELAADLGEFLADHGLQQPHLVGHSLGGKVAMHFALKHPGRIGRLVVVDIAPRAYPPWHRDILDAMLALDLRAGSRAELDDRLAASIPDAPLRQFLLKSVDRSDTGFRWRLNLEAIHRHYDELRDFPAHNETFTGPTLFLRGGKSEYVTPEDEAVVRRMFPSVKIGVIAGAGHWVHAEKPGEFVEAVVAFLSA